jgi:hypothetical protein
MHLTVYDIFPRANIKNDKAEVVIPSSLVSTHWQLLRTYVLLLFLFCFCFIFTLLVYKKLTCGNATTFC